MKVDHLRDENKEDRYGRSTYNFVMNEGSISNFFTKTSEFVKFNTVPGIKISFKHLFKRIELDKYLYAEFCGGNEGSSIGSQDE